ncbi:TIGR03545 family protein [Rubripirellula amarantea]|nr:TIGR03545 family protein [Rubripirellula amarantea]
MIRWTFVLTRLIVVVAIIVLLGFGLGPVASYVTVRGIEQATGAKAEIANTKVGLFPPRVQYLDVHIADPRDDKEMRDAVVADSIELVIDGQALMQRRWVASDGRITGLKIGTRRESSGHLEKEPEEEVESTGPSMLDRLVGDASDKLSDTADAVVGDLETLRRSKEIRARWETEYANMTDRARALEQSIREIRDRARGIDNPLRDWEELQRTLAEARAARDELLQIRTTIDGLPGQLQTDLAALDEAKRIDMEKVDRYVPGDLTGAGEFGVDIIASSVRDQIAQVKSYLDGGRTLANYTIVAPETERTRGEDYDLSSVARPSLMVRRCEIGGTMRAGGDIYEMTGVVENMTPSPDLLAEPTRARLNLDGPDSMRVEYVRDRRMGNDVDLMTLHWPEMNAKPMKLGKGGSAVAVSGGKRELWVQIRTEGDAVEGRFVSKQTGVQLDLNVADKFAGKAGVESLRNSLAAVDRIEVDANFSGTWKELDLNMNTNLGQILRRAGEDAVADQLRASKEKLAAEVNKVHAEQTVALRQWLSEQAGEARTLLASADASIEEMRTKVLSKVGNTDEVEMIGSRLRSAVMGSLR